MRIQSRLLLLVIALVVLAGCSSGPPPDPTPVPVAEDAVHILRLDSYHPEYAWSAELNAGVLRGLAFGDYSPANGNVALDYFYMDTKRNTDDAYMQQAAADALTYIQDTQPDLIIISDNNAVRLVSGALITDGSIPVVFTGLNDAPENYGLTGQNNVTGVLERAHVEETFDWIGTVFPEATRITGIFDDSATSAAYLPAVESALASSVYAGSPLNTTNSFSEWQDMVRVASGDGSAALVVGTYHTLRDDTGNAVAAPDVMAWTVENSLIPVVPFWEFSIPEGALGGEVISGETQGFEAGQMAARILDGESPGAITIMTPVRGKLVLNQAAIEHWGVTIPQDIMDNSEIYTP